MYEADYPKAAKAFVDLCINHKQLGMTFQDVLLEPQYSKIESRSIIALEVNITPLRKLSNPIIAANMDTICDSTMAKAMRRLGGNGVIHRYMDYDQQAKEVYKTSLDSGSNAPVMAAVGVKNGVVDQVKKLVDHGCSIIVIDVAHGHHILVGDLLGKLKALDLKAIDNLPVEYIAGNVATPAGVRFLCETGADGVKVGVGAGSICSTRTVTGHGIPQMLAIATCSLEAAGLNIPVVADGGFKTTGDIVKALAIGASTIMTGYLLAGTNECPQKAHTSNGNQAIYRGMASKDSQQEFYGNEPNAPEGVVAQIEHKGSIEKVMNRILASIQSGLSYSGAGSISELQEKASFLKISEATMIENLTVRS